MVTVVRVEWESVLIGIGDCVRVKGDTGGVGRHKYAKWYGKIVGFDLEGAEQVEVDTTHSKKPFVKVNWFYAVKDICRPLELAKFEDEELTMMRDALPKSQYLLGTESHNILIQTIQAVVTALDISGLCSFAFDEQVFWYRWRFNDSNILNFPYEIVAEKWCIDGCRYNRFWKINEVLWFCVRCEFWFHYDCCEVVPERRRVYCNLVHFATMPLLKGGDLGLAGTAPLAFAAIRTMEAVEADGGERSAEFMSLLGNALDSSGKVTVCEIMEAAEDYVTADIKCPICGS